MTFPQGIPFRSTEAYVTDTGNNDSENSTSNALDADVTATNYPRTTTQGNSVGWEVIDTTGDKIQTRNRNTAGGQTLSGHHRIPATSTAGVTYRIDLPSSGNYLVRLASGDYTYGSAPSNVKIYDDTTLLATLASGTTSAGQHWFDATNVERTSVSDWTANNASQTLTFASTICRIKIGTSGAAAGVISYFYIESAGGAPSSLPLIGITRSFAVRRSNTY
jgi:hypothetical protein